MVAVVVAVVGGYTYMGEGFKSSVDKKHLFCAV